MSTAPGGHTDRRVGVHAALAVLVVILFTVAYFGITWPWASLKPLSFDELTTYNIASMGTAREVWGAWYESGDGVPPVIHFAVHLVGSIFGFSPGRARSPDMIGFWVMCLCIFIVLIRRVHLGLAVAGMLLPLTVPTAYSYAFEARGYGVVLACSGAAVVCWDRAGDPRWRRAALVGLPLCLAGAFATHLYAVLLIVPLGLAELTRTIEHRRVDVWSWLGLVVPLLLFVPVNPIISHIRSLSELSRYSRGPRVRVLVLWDLVQQFLSTPVTYLGLLALMGLGLDRAFVRDSPATPPQGERRVSPSDWVLVLCLAGLPVIGWLFANLVTGILLFRYVIGAVIGFSLAVALLCGRVALRRPGLGLLFAAWVAVTAGACTMDFRYLSRTSMFTRNDIALGYGCFRLVQLSDKLPADGLPIVVSDFNLFHQLYHYAPEHLRQRLVFVVDEAFGGLIEPYIPYYARVFRLRMERLTEFFRSHPSFYLYDCGTAGRLPLIARFLDAGASLHPVEFSGTPDILQRRDLYLVSMDRATGDRARATRE